MERNFKIFGIAGSLRQESYNRALLRAAQDLAPSHVELSIFERLGEIPHYNHDMYLRGEPEVVRELTTAIAQADAVLIATPEYNYSIPGVLKTAIEWASRPSGQSVLRDKPVGILGASMGNFGTVRAQRALREILQEPAALVLSKPEVLVAQAASRFDAQGHLSDEPTIDILRTFLSELRAWTRRLELGREERVAA